MWREVSTQYLNWVKNPSQKWGAAMVEAPEEERRDDFAGGDHDRNGEQEGKQLASGDQAALGRPIQLLSERCRLGADVAARVSLLSVLGSNLSEPTQQVAGAA